MSSSKAISRLDVENPALSFENLGTPSIGAKKSYSSNSLESMSTSKFIASSENLDLWKSYRSLLARGASGATGANEVKLPVPDPLACQRVYTPKYVKSYSPDWFGFVSPGNYGSMFTVPDPDYFHFDIEYKVDPFIADLIANFPPPLKKSSSECCGDSPEPCRICYNTHGFTCPFCVGYSSFDVDKWVCNRCGSKTAALGRKYCIICRSYTKHCTYECPKDEALAAQHNLLRYKPKAAPYVPESSLNDS
ncbi:chaperone protein DnaJ [Striga asiatica]|uniref:Chaperone protein DnaJ n=1 Tax=Striga asiatica TaxID=4170 RepID=A0A5A7QF09_STRAF|nr:chaperone protein DnaJ [Striga asiatica]